VASVVRIGTTSATFFPHCGQRTLLGDFHVSEQMSSAVAAPDPLMFRQATAVLLLLVVMMFFAACGGAPTTTGPPSATPASPSSSPPISGTATLSWDPVTKDLSGEPLTDLAGYIIHYGTSAQALNSVLALENPNQTTYVVTGLSPGTWYFAVSAYTASGTESALSNIVSKTIS